jgi:pimeloyl-ACP methyl ester carboxylesterase
MTHTLIAAILFTLILLSCFIAPPDKASAASFQKADLSKVSFRMIETNGIRMHIAEQGQGPLVILCHGFPESWYSWRHQIPALAAAGYHVVAPDQRGYGKTDRPEAIEDYNMLQLAGDIVGLVKALGEEKAIIVGHDWGAAVAAQASLLRPDLFRATILLSVPFSPRRKGATAPMEAAKQMPGNKIFYQVYFQQPGVAEAELEKDVRRSILMMLYYASGDAPATQRFTGFFDRGGGMLSAYTVPEKLPAWIQNEDLDIYAQQFKESGFRGPLNWYRNIDRNWKAGAAMLDARLTQPALFIAGEHDVVVAGFGKGAYERLEENMPQLRKKVLIPGKGHWIQQESPAEVNRLMIEFLAVIQN